MERVLKSWDLRRAVNLVAILDFSQENFERKLVSTSSITDQKNEFQQFLYFCARISYNEEFKHKVKTNEIKIKFLQKIKYTIIILKCI